MQGALQRERTACATRLSSALSFAFWRAQFLDLFETGAPSAIRWGADLHRVKNILLLPVYALLLYVPIVSLLWTLFRQRKRHEAAARMPFSDLRRRPAGESLRVDLENLTAKIDEWIVVISFSPVVLALMFAVSPRPSAAGLALFFLLVAILAAVAFRALKPVLQKRHDYLLGYHGERYVAEELNLLMTDGFDVFHDVPFDNFNIDHVLLGPTGLFVVETKTRRKPVIEGEARYEVVFDGEALDFPNGRNVEGPAQTRLNRETLSRWISSATADRITAAAILTVPGWWVTCSARSDLFVVNPKQIRPLVMNHRGSPLSPEVVQRARHQLEEKCRLALVS